MGKKTQPVGEESFIPNLQSLIAGSVTLGNKEFGFKVIKRYNNSHKYSICVYLLLYLLKESDIEMIT